MTTQTDGAIGYVEYAYAKQNKMAYALLVNKGGKAVAPSAESFQAAAANADWAHAPGYYLILTDQAGAASWPITGASFILVYGQPPDPAATAEALKFFDWAYKSGDADGADLDYVPLPEALIKQVRATWKARDQGHSGAGRRQLRSAVRRRSSDVKAAAVHADRGGRPAVDRGRPPLCCRVSCRLEYV